MLLEQEQAIEQVEKGINLLSDTLVDRLDVEEDAALEIVRGLPGLVDRIQDGDMVGLLKEAAYRARHPRRVVMSGPDPDELYPEHKNYMPRVTTKTTYNEHMAKAMTPYVTAIATKIAHDRGVVAPDTHTITAVLEKTDWARAAYDAKTVTPRNPSKVREFVRKYFFRPLDAVSKHGISMNAILVASISLQLVFALFKQYKMAEQLLAVAGAQSPWVSRATKFSQGRQRRQQRKAWKRAGYKRPPRFVVH